MEYNILVTSEADYFFSPRKTSERDRDGRDTPAGLSSSVYVFERPTW